jgi:hypothetical protein
MSSLSCKYSLNLFLLAIGPRLRSQSRVYTFFLLTVIFISFIDIDSSWFPWVPWSIKAILLLIPDYYFCRTPTPPPFSENIEGRSICLVRVMFLCALGVRGFSSWISLTSKAGSFRDSSRERSGFWTPHYSVATLWVPAGPTITLWPPSIYSS